MKTYKKPISILVVVDAEELLGASNPFASATTTATTTEILEGTYYGGTVSDFINNNNGNTPVVDSKGWDCWE